MILPVEGCLLPGPFGAVRSGAVVLSADFRCNMICGTSLRMCRIGLRTLAADMQDRLPGGASYSFACLFQLFGFPVPFLYCFCVLSCPVLSRSVPFVCGFRTVSISVLFCPSPVLSQSCSVPVLSCPCPVLFCLVLSCSCLVLSYPILSCSCLVLFCLSCPCPVLFCRVLVLSCLVSISALFCSVPVLSCPVSFRSVLFVPPLP